MGWRIYVVPLKYIEDEVFGDLVMTLGSSILCLLKRDYNWESQEPAKDHYKPFAPVGVSRSMSPCSYA